MPKGKDDNKKAKTDEDKKNIKKEDLSKKQKKDEKTESRIEAKTVKETEAKEEKKDNGADNKEWKKFGAFIESTGVETAAEDDTGRESLAREILQRRLETIVGETPTENLPSLSANDDPTKYAPSGKFYTGNAYGGFKYEDMNSKYTPAVDPKTMEALRSGSAGLEYHSMAQESPMLEKTEEARKLEEGKQYKARKERK